jgi:hypothetical protein
MHKNNLPTYAIVELLMRLAQHNTSIGDYKNHSAFDEGVMVKTSGGTIRFPMALIMQQFEDPEMVSDTVLLNIASSFKPLR